MKELNVELLKELEKQGFQSLESAVFAQNIDIFKLFIKANVDLNIKDTYSGQTCLHFCAGSGNLSIAKLLVEHGANLSIADYYGNHPLWTACFNSVKMVCENRAERLEMIRYFLENGADKHHKNKAVLSPLDMAIKVNYEPLLEIIGLAD
jgi:uncharacterized protein